MIISFLTLKKISPLSNRISKNSDSNLIQKARKNTASFQNSVVLLFLQYYQSWQNYLEIVAALVIYIYWWMISISKINTTFRLIYTMYQFCIFHDYIICWTLKYSVFWFTQKRCSFYSKQSESIFVQSLDATQQIFHINILHYFSLRKVISSDWFRNCE